MYDDNRPDVEPSIKPSTDRSSTEEAARRTQSHGERLSDVDATGSTPAPAIAHPQAGNCSAHFWSLTKCVFENGRCVA